MWLRVHETHQIRILWGVGGWAGCVLASIAIELDREHFRKLLGETETEFVQNSKVLVDLEVSNMNPKKKSRRCLGLGLDSGLDSFTALVARLLATAAFWFRTSNPDISQ